MDITGIERVAVPVNQDFLCGHFGGAPAMALFDVDAETRAIRSRQDLPTPPHQPGVLPEWIAEHGVDLVLAGGIGERAIIMLAEAGIRVMPGVAEQPVQEAVEAWLNGRLETHANACRGGHHGHEHRHGSDDALS